MMVVSSMEYLVLGARSTYVRYSIYSSRKPMKIILLISL